MRFATRLMARVLGVSVIAACGTEPQGPPLEGQWGFEPGVTLVATAASVDLDLTCSTFHAERPLVPGSDGRFDLSGRYSQPFGMLERDARVTGQEVDNHVFIHLTVEGVTANSPTYELLPGLVPTGEVQCPL
jgi:hypothetical protein